MEPGEVTASSQFTARSLNGLLRAIETWLQCLREDGQAEPQWRNLDAWRKDLDEKLAELLADKVEPGPLSREEQQSMKAGLDEMEAKWKAQFEEAVADQAELKRRVNELHDTVEFLKDQVSRLDRPSFQQAMITRICVWLGKEENQKLLKTGGDVIVVVSDTIKRLGG